MLVSKTARVHVPWGLETSVFTKVLCTGHDKGHRVKSSQGVSELKAKVRLACKPPMTAEVALT